MSPVVPRCSVTWALKGCASRIVAACTMATKRRLPHSSAFRGFLSRLPPSVRSVEGHVRCGDLDSTRGRPLGAHHLCTLRRAKTRRRPVYKPVSAIFPWSGPCLLARRSAGSSENGWRKSCRAGQSIWAEWAASKALVPLPATAAFASKPTHHKRASWIELRNDVMTTQASATDGHR